MAAASSSRAATAAALAEWAAGPHRCLVAATADEEGDVSLRTTEAVSRLEPVLTVPYSKLLTPAAATAVCQTARIPPPAAPDALLITALAIASESGPSSPWYPYCAALPRALPGLAWHLKADAAPGTRPPCLHWEWLCAASGQLQESVSALLTPAVQAAGVERDGVRWAAAMFHSRAMRVPPPSGAAGAMLPAMVPLGDLANHSSASEASWRAGAAAPAAPKRRRLLDDDGSDEGAATPCLPAVPLLHLMPHGELEAGAEVLIPYGHKPNSELLLKFGFVDGEAAQDLPVALQVLPPTAPRSRIRLTPGALAVAPPAALWLTHAGGEADEAWTQLRKAAAAAATSSMAVTVAYIRLGATHGVQQALCAAAVAGEAVEGSGTAARAAAAADLTALRPPAAAPAALPHAALQRAVETWRQQQAALVAAVVAQAADG